MHKTLKTTLCLAVAAVAAGSIATTAACSGYYRATALEGNYEYTDVVSNGGFVVEAGDYVYFINGVEDNTADNTYGDVEKGSILRISHEDMSKGDYTDGAQTVVPLVAYSADYSAGIYIYGDYIYYTTPASTRNSDGEVLNDYLDVKRTKLDGTETSKKALFQVEDSSVEYRIVKPDDGDDADVYYMYVISEQLYDEEEETTNIHSVNLTTGEDTLLAYNVSSYAFDTEDVTNPYIYYTMDVVYYLGMDNIETTASYNQVYRVRADETEGAHEYDFSYVEEYDADFDIEETPLYINLGELVFDGVGKLTGLTQFNYYYDSNEMDPAGNSVDASESAAYSLSGYTYELISYEEGTLYYNRTYYSSDDDALPLLFYTNDSIIGEEDYNPVTANPDTDDDAEENYSGLAVLLNGSSASDYTFVRGEGGETNGVIYSETSSSGEALVYATVSGGALVYETDRVVITNESAEITMLTTSEENVGNNDYNFLYYSVSGEEESYSVYRIAIAESDDLYKKGKELYEMFPRYEDSLENYRSVKILDLNVVNSWYSPEVVAGHLFFASDTDDMVDYNYIMVFDLRDNETKESGESVNNTMSNQEIEELNELYEEITDEDDGVIAEIDDDEYQYLPDALTYAFISRDIDYIDELVELWVDEGEDADYLYSEDSVRIYKEFINAQALFEKYQSYSRDINGEKVYATSRDYYYCLIGYMDEDDEEDYIEALRTSHMQSEPDDEGWFEGLSTGAKVGFIIGVVAGGLIIIAVAVLIPIYVKRKKRREAAAEAGEGPKRIFIDVDTTDDKNIDVYNYDGTAEADGPASPVKDEGADAEIAQDSGVEDEKNKDE